MRKLLLSALSTLTLLMGVSVDFTNEDINYIALYADKAFYSGSSHAYDGSQVEYENTGALTKVHKGDEGWYYYKSGDDQRKFLGANETFTVEDKWFEGDVNGGDKTPMSIAGDGSAGQKVIISGNKFTNINQYAIDIKDVEEIVIEGNLIDTTFGGIRVKNFKKLTIRYNKIKDWGVIESGDEYGHVISSSLSKDVEVFDIASNLIDCGNDPRYTGTAFTDQELKDRTIRTDWVNSRAVQMLNGTVGHIRNNIAVGSEHVGEAGTAGTFICDSFCVGIEVDSNIALNSAQSMFSVANGKDITFKNNKGYYTLNKMDTLSYFHASDLDASDVYRGHYGVLTNWYGSSHATDGIPDDFYQGFDSVNVVHENNIFSFEDGGVYSKSQILTLDEANVGTEIILGTDCNYKLGSWRTKDVWDETAHINDMDKNNPPNEITANEIYQELFGVDYGTATDNKLFEKWGTANNNTKYFNESRL